MCAVGAEPHNLYGVTVVQHPGYRAGKLGHADQLVPIVGCHPHLIAVHWVVVTVDTVYKGVGIPQLNWSRL